MNKKEKMEKRTKETIRVQMKRKMISESKSIIQMMMRETKTFMIEDMNVLKQSTPMTVKKTKFLEYLVLVANQKEQKCHSHNKKQVRKLEDMITKEKGKEMKKVQRMTMST